MPAERGPRGHAVLTRYHLPSAHLCDRLPPALELGESSCGPVDRGCEQARRSSFVVIDIVAKSVLQVGPMGHGALHIRLESGPARKAMLAGYHKLCVGEFSRPFGVRVGCLDALGRGGITIAVGAQKVLCLFPKMLQARGLRERRLHGSLLIRIPRSAYTGRIEGRASPDCSTGVGSALSADGARLRPRRSRLDHVPVQRDSIRSLPSLVQNLRYTQVLDRRRVSNAEFTVAHRVSTSRGLFTGGRATRFTIVP